MIAPHEVRARLERLLVLRTLALPKPLLRRLAGPKRRSPDGLELDLSTQVLLRLMRLAREPEMHVGGPEIARIHLERSAKVADLREDFEVSVRDSRIPGPAGEVPVRIYVPQDAQSPCPVLVFLHGGGFVVGSIDTHDDFCRALAHLSRIVVVSVGYRLAPEHPFPAGLEDAIAVTRWIIANAASVGGDPYKVAIGGDSAGGNLSAGVALACRHDPIPPAFQLLLYPATDATRSLPSHRDFRDGFFLTERSIAWFLEQYVRDPKDRKDPRVSPLFANDLEGAPPALVVTAGFDPLRDEGRAYAARLEQAQVSVDFREYPGAIHGFLLMGGLLPLAREAVRDVAGALRRALHGPVDHARGEPMAEGSAG